MSIAKLVVPCLIAASLTACATSNTANDERILAVCGEPEVPIGSTIAKRDKCVDKTPEGQAAAREKGEEMLRAQRFGQTSSELLKSKVPGG